MTNPPPMTRATSLAHMDGIKHGFFGRRGGVSEGLYGGLNVGEGSADDPASVAQNREIVREALGATHLLSCYQIHSADALLIRAPFTERPEGDAMVTKVPGLALCILTADCTPVLLADPQAGVIGAAHAGWKGAIGGVIDVVVEAMESIGASADRITAAIGPTIAQTSYEVGPEFRDRFLSEVPSSERYFIPGAGDRLHFDLPGFVRAQLVRAGIPRIDLIAHDTCAMEAEYFSNRRRNKRGEPDYGRNGSVIVLQDKI